MQRDTPPLCPSPVNDVGVTDGFDVAVETPRWGVFRRGAVGDGATDLSDAVRSPTGPVADGV